MKLVFSFLICLLVSTKAKSQIDALATQETKALYRNLKKLQNQAILFGHQDGLAYGLNADSTHWVGDEGRSDVKTVSNQFPAVLGWDLGKIEFDSLQNLDQVPFTKIRQGIIETYQRGGLNTISWHLNNPTNPSKSSWDKVDSTIVLIQNSPEYLKIYTNWLDKVTLFLSSLHGPKGELVPVIFRPFHEHTGSWFWWGAAFCTPAQYQQFWQFTVNYLQKTKGVHNLLIAYSTDQFDSKEHYLERYPGDQYVDLVGFDCYHRNAPSSNESFKTNLARMVTTLSAIANEHQKLCAVTEIGLERITVPDWWTSILLPSLIPSRLSYFLVWRNGRTDHFYAPFEGHSSASDFNKMVDSGKVYLEQATRKLKLYQTNLGTSRKK